MKVGDISKIEPNVHAGSKYMDQLITTYFPDAELDEANRTLFAFAAYNAGPGRLAKLRKVAAEQGYDPNKWFNNVERVVAQKVGQEPVTYVRNIYKYNITSRTNWRSRPNRHGVPLPSRFRRPRPNEPRSHLTPCCSGFGGC
jgi:membrane-bound lytic murein transglycosylase MltF